ncbi:MAG TPA: hypothetical protein VL123_04000 [Candidatus Udaeobacter sp.]|nr:hypothetical protein [Candidatus Udaeobacter sp.]
MIRFSTAARTPAVDARCDHLDLARFGERLWKRDDALWLEDPAHRAVAANRLGWLGVAARMRGEIPALRAFASEVAAEGFTHAVLLGMGGSSLAPEVLDLSLGRQSGPGQAPSSGDAGRGRALELSVLDNTSPAAVRDVAASHDPERTLFIVSSKSGGTLEVSSFEKYFYDWARAARGDGTGRGFIAITDPGTPLEELARERGYRRTFLNPPDIGGRYSALSYFGIVPAALIGADLDQLLGGAERMAAESAGSVPARNNPGLLLGAALGELALAGRTKLTLVLPPRLAALGGWIEQLIAESTGKDGRGIVPIVDEPLTGPEMYGRDRVFLVIGREGLDAGDRRRLDALEAMGQAVIEWPEEARVASALGSEFLRWEIATATAGSVLGVDPFDEPNVAEAKQATQTVLQRWIETGRFESPAPLARTGEVQVFAPPAVAARLRPATGAGPLAVASAALGLGLPGEYFALLCYMHRTPERHALLQKLRLAIRDATRLATTLGYGPRFLHSTGQLHKGGPNIGVFLQLTADEGADVPIPGERYGFAALQKSQAAGDYQVLERRGRRVVRVHLGAGIEQTIDELISALDTRVRV